MVHSVKMKSIPAFLRVVPAFFEKTSLPTRRDFGQAQLAQLAAFSSRNLNLSSWWHDEMLMKIVDDSWWLFAISNQIRWKSWNVLSRKETDPLSPAPWGKQQLHLDFVAIRRPSQLYISFYPYRILYHDRIHPHETVIKMVAFIIPVLATSGTDIWGGEPFAARPPQEHSPGLCRDING